MTYGGKPWSVGGILLIIINICVAICGAQLIKEDENIHYNVVNATVLKKSNITIPAYYCKIVVDKTDQNMKTNTHEIKLPKSNCSTVIKNGILHIMGRTYYNITRNGISTYEFIEGKGNETMDILLSIELKEFTIIYDIISKGATLPSEFDIRYYENFICDDQLQNINVFCDRYEVGYSDAVSLYYYGPAKLHSSKAIPYRKSVDIHMLDRIFTLHLRNNHILDGKIVVWETDEEKWLVSFETEETLLKLFKPSFKEDPLKELPFENIDDHKKLRQNLVTHNQNEDSQNEANEGVPVTKEEIENAEIQQTTTSNRVEKNIDDTISDRQITTNTAEQSTSDTSSHQEPKDQRDNLSICIVVSCLVVGGILVFLVGRVVFKICYRKPNDRLPQTQQNKISTTQPLIKSL